MNSTNEGVLCSANETNVFLKNVSAEYGNRWRDFGIFCVYVIFSVAATVGLYWLARVPKREFGGEITQSAENEKS